MNKNYKIYYKEEMRNNVIAYLEDYSNDILINTYNDQIIGITIENEKEKKFFNNLLENIESDVYTQNQ